MFEQFGGKITKEVKDKYATSTNWDGEKFVNLSETTMDVNLKTLPRLIKEQLTNKKGRSPREPLKVRKFDSEKFSLNPDKAKLVWFGHSVVLLQIDGKNLLIDPMFGLDAAPIAPFKSKRFSEDTLTIIDSLPPLDAILFTHDHYDHLDYSSFLKLKDMTNTFLVALGVARHLEKWGVPSASITEFDWWDETVFEGIKITFTPSRHFAGRGPFDRAKSLWGGWVFKGNNSSIYWSGDGGYDTHFVTIGEKLGPFDFAFIECGQYNELWKQIHMMPEETVQAAIDVQALVSMPVHWGGFALAMHSWKEPVERFFAAAQKRQVAVVVPQLGEVVVIGDEQIPVTWWENLE